MERFPKILVIICLMIKLEPDMTLNTKIILHFKTITDVKHNSVFGF